MKRLSLWLMFSATVVFAAFYTSSRKVITPSGRAASLVKQYAMATIEAGAEKQETEDQLKQAAEAKGEVYLPKFEIPPFPDRKALAEMRALLRDGDQIWSFHGLDSGWLILRDDREVFLLVTSHDY